MDGKINEVDIVIISWAKDQILQQVTIDGINSLLKEKNVLYHIYIVESNHNVNYDDHNINESKHTITTIHPDVPFGYHRYLNIGRKAGNSKYVCLCNNDLTFESGWSNAIINAMEQYPQIESASPWCPQTQGPAKLLNQIWIGHQVRRELAGWCIFQQRKIYDKIGDLDEDFTFWYSDNIYALELQLRGISHALIGGSIVNHHDGNLGKTGLSIDEKTKIKYTSEESKVFERKSKILIEKYSNKENKKI